MATQNPVEQEGTYPLPEAQLDRFLFKLVVGYPKESEYHDILDRTVGATEMKIKAVSKGPEIIPERALVGVSVPLHDGARRYYEAAGGARFGAVQKLKDTKMIQLNQYVISFMI